MSWDVLSNINLLWLLAVLPAAWLLTIGIVKCLTVFFNHRNKTVTYQKDAFYSLKAPVFTILLFVGSYLVLSSINFDPNRTLDLPMLFSRLYIISGTWLLVRAVRLIKIVAFTRFDIQVADNLRARKVRTQFQFLERTAN